MNGWSWLGIAVLLGAAVLVGLNAKDLARYVKIKTM